MRVPLGWVREYVEIGLPVRELARKLTFAGLEVEAVDYLGLPEPAGDERPECKVTGVAWEPSLVVVGELVGVEPHPDADRLVVARVNDGEGVRTSVSGAPNLAPLAGTGPLAEPLKVAVARPGARLVDPGQRGRRLKRLEPATIRGVESRLMICSEKELGLSEAHEGVLVLDADAPPAGTPLAEAFGDVVLDIAITPNIVRNASILGVAREIAALTGATLEPPSTAVEAGGPPVAEKVTIEIRQPELNPRFTATLLEGAAIGPSPFWLRHRLLLAGMRPISNVVDVTNYVMLELGQPLHAFDYDALARRAGGTPKIITRLPEAGERLTTLDGEERRLDEFTVLVADTAGALSIGGIMGGADSEVSDATVNVLLEAAAWNFLNIRRTVLSQQLDSEAGYRFSRGVHPAMAPRANLRAIELMRRLAGGEVAAGMVDVAPLPPPEVVVTLPQAEITRALGVEIPRDEVVGILEALEFGVETEGEGEGAVLTVSVPDHRLDVGQGAVGVADLVEEIARVWGYERIPETQIHDAMPPQHDNRALELEERCRDLLAAMGLQEVVSYRLTTPEREAAALRPGAEPDPRPYVELQNPISSERRVMRHALLPSVLEVAAANARHRGSLALFEIGPVYLPRAGEPLPEEPGRLALVLAGALSDGGWDDGGDGARPADLYDLKGVLEALAADLHLPPLEFERGRHEAFHPGRAAAVRLADEPLGELGELHPQVRDGYGLPFERVVAAELDLERLLAAAPERFAVQPVSAFPPVVEDLAFVVGEAIAAAAVERSIADAGGGLLRDVSLFDLYRGDQLGDGLKSLAFRLTYQAEDRTLTDGEVAELRREIVAAVAAATGGRLRE